MATKKKPPTAEPPKQQPKPKPPAVGAPAPAAPPSAAAELRLLVVDVRLLAIVVSLALAGGFVWLIKETLVTLLFVVVVTFLGAPFVDRLAKRMPRAVAALLVVAGAALLVLALLALVLPALISDLVDLVQKLPALLRKGAEWLQTNFDIVIPTTVADLSSEASKELLAQLTPFAKSGGALVGAGTVGVLRGAAGAAAFVGRALLVPILAYFLLAELPKVRELVRNLVPRSTHGLLRHYLPKVEDTLSGLVRGQLLVAGIMALIYVIGLSICGVPLAFAIGVIAGAAYFVPFASTGVCLILTIAFSLAEKGGDALFPIVGAAITCVVVQLAESYFLTPRIVGEKAGLSPLAAMLAVLLGASAAGFLGVLMALPVGAVVALVLREESMRRGGLLTEATS